MKKKMKLLPVVLVSVLALGLLAGLAFAQGTGKGEAASATQPEGPKVTMTGKVVFMKNFGGYVVISDKPHEEYKVINENKKELEPLAREGKTVSIEGRLPKGAYFLFIEKIDGKNYQEAK
jgi:hypothetical protein